LLNYSKICTLTGTLSVIVINSVYIIDTRKTVSKKSGKRKHGYKHVTCVSSGVKLNVGAV